MPVTAGCFNDYGTAGSPATQTAGDHCEKKRRAKYVQGVKAREKEIPGLKSILVDAMPGFAVSGQPDVHSCRLSDGYFRRLRQTRPCPEKAATQDRLQAESTPSARSVRNRATVQNIIPGTSGPRLKRVW